MSHDHHLGTASPIRFRLFCSPCFTFLRNSIESHSILRVLVPSGRVVAKSDEINEAEDKQAKQLVAGIKQEEYNRNRARVSEVYELIQRYAKAIEEKLSGGYDM